MSERWIKMTHELQRKPEVMQVARKLDAPPELQRFAAIAGLYVMWCLFDEQTTDGHLSGYTLTDLDTTVGLAGFGEAVVSAGWLEQTAEGLTMPNFDEHTSATAKGRASDARRKRQQRKTKPDKCPDVSGHQPGPEQNRIEQKRTELSLPPSRALEWGGVSDQLIQCGVKAAGKCVRDAARHGWTPSAAMATVQHFRDHPGAWQPYQLYTRLSSRPREPAEDWPEQSAQYLTAQREASRLRRAEAEQQAERARQANQRASRTAPFGLDLAKRLRSRMTETEQQPADDTS